MNPSDNSKPNPTLNHKVKKPGIRHISFNLGATDSGDVVLVTQIVMSREQAESLMAGLGQAIKTAQGRESSIVVPTVGLNPSHLKSVLEKPRG